MNDKKIAFISCINDHELYDEAQYYISQLVIPTGYTVETIAIENAPSMTAGYNQGMKASDAKYKVYLHQDTFIINKNFIEDILRLFDQDQSIGMIGVAGCRNIPSNGVWWEDPYKVGKVYDSHTGSIDLLNFSEVFGDYEPVQGIDGLIMITQYDIPWREDLFKGWHFYDLSQCREFALQGYKVVVPNQEDPWIIHDCDIVNVQNSFDKYRQVFLDTYGQGIFSERSHKGHHKSEDFPLVSILIPAYNQTVYLEQALESAIAQTYPNIEIIIGDDSDHEQVKEFIEPYLRRYKNIFYFRNERTTMDYGISNVENLFLKSKGDFIAYLLHDDVFHPDKVTRMMEHFSMSPDVVLVTSYRKLINHEGALLEDQPFNRPLVEVDTLLKGREISDYMVANSFNPIGEFSTAMFRKNAVTGKIIGYHNQKIMCNGDLTLWLRLLEKGDMIYLRDCLSYFRQHPKQNSHEPLMQVRGVLDHLNIITEYYQLNRDIGEAEQRKNIINCFVRNAYVFSLLDVIDDELLKKQILSKYETFLRNFD